MITNSSSNAQLGNFGERYGAVRVFPDFRIIKDIPHTQKAIEAFVREFLLPNGQNRDSTLDHQTSDPGGLNLYKVKKLRRPTILICGHASRDARCGITGPLLRSEFLKHSAYRVITKDARKFWYGRLVHMARRGTALYTNRQTNLNIPDVSTVSHIGGHAFAGSVIIYIPPGWLLPDGDISPLAGRGIWYGRVEPRHVEGIYNETVLEGNVIKEHFRGGIGQGGEILRL